MITCPMFRRLGAALVLTMAVVAGACSSTLSREQVGAAAGRVGTSRTAAGENAVAEGAPDIGAAPVPVGPTTGGSAVATPGPGGRTGSAPSPAYQPGVPVLTQGITATSIKIGVPVIANAEAVGALLGAADIRPGDNGLEARAIVADINRNGGINGRQIDAQYYAVDFGVPATVEANALTACNYFADDQKVFAILMVINPPASFVACAAQKGVVLLNGSLNPLDDQLIAAASPWYYSPSTASQSRVWGPLLDSVGRRGGIARGDKVAVFALDKPVFTRTAEQVTIPALRARGYEVVAYERIATEASIQNAVLRFRQSGATHVVFVQESGIGDLLFMRQAEAQQYRPKYLLTTYDVSGYLLEDNVADAQLAGVMGIGWQPVFDVESSEYPQTAEETYCLAQFAKGGEPGEHRQTHLTAMPMCDLVLSFAAIARAAGPDLSTVTFQQGYRSIGTSYRSVMSLATDFSRGVDAVSGFRPTAYVAACRCIRYVGPLEPMP